jgi:hypothetical protein
LLEGSAVYFHEKVAIEAANVTQADGMT